MGERSGPHSKSEVRTVTGGLDAGSLGVVLPHEHLIHSISVHSGRADNACLDVELAAAECRRFRDAGGGAICDVTPLGLGRDLAALRAVSEASGVAVISALGLYEIWTQPDEVRGRPARVVADYLERGAERCGLIGEIASHNEPGHADWRRYSLNASERDLFAGAARAQRRTGLAVTTHASLGRGGVAQGRMLVDSGADPARVIIGHCDAHLHDEESLDLDYYDALLALGVCLEFDLFGWEELAPDALRARRIATLCAAGHAGRLLISTDTCRRSQLHACGGRGFDYLFTSIIPALRAAGVSQADIDTMTRANPSRLLSIR